MFIGSFGKFRTDTVVVIIALKAAGVSQLLLDLTNNWGEIMDNNLGFYSLLSTVSERVIMS